ncbi:MAG: TetR/AcrR family transcriptional regulator [Geobacter sp.]|nr:TetR/AcrR family transcriptional regulator [Geobacter sp.]
MTRSKATTSRQHHLQAGSENSTACTADRIIAATLNLLQTRCLHSISIRDIAAKADVNSALISYHFKSKENLYTTVVASLFKAYQEQVVSSFTTEGDLRETIRAACQALATFHQSNPCWLTLYFRELGNPSSVYRSIILPSIKDASDRCVAMINAGIKAGVIEPAANPRHITLSLVGMINYFFMTRQIMQDLALEPANNVDDYINFVCQTLLRSDVAE